ncbi:uncharacterized protein LOC132278753 isoform X2 [Cornus florida]|uniref:uncharacterized protein LOC132278753 isoform X2 n=1 Tax=Cornus florida TaxID=4283 RepID=UPI0028973928|nr:uncharacterized protein LOC132278753 isoform X2 [Cornus florida]XP_059636609.1 uncharacterized protein LOC132278753 isoform X2 [Cornus florida]XP_059636610.1 uncharacterized protein LOC132278753 isoform X2 [Cornus florida]XP_059636611.1 uncharacterized protein LOC132278753 isoform X2 [Cornus florida]
MKGCNHGLRPYLQQRPFILGFDKTRTISTRVAHGKAPRIGCNHGLRPYLQQRPFILGFDKTRTISTRVAHGKAPRIGCNHGLRPYLQQRPFILGFDKTRTISTRVAHGKAPRIVGFSHLGRLHDDLVSSPSTRLRFLSSISILGTTIDLKCPYLKDYKKEFFGGEYQKKLEEIGRYLDCLDLDIGQLEGRVITIPDFMMWIEFTGVDINEIYRCMKEQRIFVVRSSNTYVEIGNCYIESLLQSPMGTFRWTCPPWGCYAMNSDGSFWKGQKGKAAWAAVLRDYSGEIQEIKTGSLITSTWGNFFGKQVEEAEGYGIYYGFVWAKRLGYKKVFGYSDCKSVVDAINGERSLYFWDLKYLKLYKKVKNIMASFEFCTLEWQPRETNEVADFVVKQTMRGVDFDEEEAKRLAKEDLIHIYKWS